MHDLCSGGNERVARRRRMPDSEAEEGGGKGRRGEEAKGAELLVPRACGGEGRLTEDQLGGWQREGIGAEWARERGAHQRRSATSCD